MKGQKTVMARMRRIGLCLLLGTGAVYSVPGVLALVARDAWSLFALVAPAYLLLLWCGAEMLWPDAERVRVVLLGVYAALIVGVLDLVGAVVLWGFTIDAHLCGSDGSSTSGSGYATGSGVAALIAAYAFSQPRRRVLPSVVGAVLIGILVAMGITEAIPSNHGTFCET